MPQFSYRARDNEGLAINGIVDASSELAVLGNLKNLGYRVIQIKKLNTAKKHWEKILQKIRRVTQQEVILFARQLSAMMKSGLPITTALTSLSQQVKNEIFIQVIQDILEDIEKGSSFSEALSKHPSVFNDLFVNMIKAGETAGVLDEVLDRLVLLNTQELETGLRIRSAMIYPVILVVAAIAIVSFLMVGIIPKFVTVFETYDAQLPKPTVVLLILSNLISKLGFLLILVLGGGFFWLRKYFRTQKGRYRFHMYLLRIPFLGEFYVKVIVSRFTRILGVLVRSGVPILEALDVTEKTINNVVISRVIHRIRIAVSEGQALSEPFQASGIFPPMVIQMIAVGEKSGRVDQMLVDIASFYDQETEYAIKNVTTTLEPVLLLTMGGIVAFIALSVLLPIFNLIKVFRGGI